MSRLLLAALLALAPGQVLAQAAPQVVTDIAPVQGLAARVMEGVGEPALLIPPGASPHDYALKPSQAGALSRAQLVFMVGPELTPWLVKPVESLAAGAARIDLIDLPGTHVLASRTGATFEAHHHDGEEASAAGEHQGGPDHDHGHDHDHDHGGVDPHAWLDPENGKLWMSAMAEALAQQDPPNAATYRANAAAGAAEIDAAAQDAARTLVGMDSLRFIVLHDAFQYFERRFGLAAVGSVSLSDASQPSPARIAALREAVAREGATCALAEPQFNSGLLATVFDGSGAHTAVLDPLGTTLPAGPQFYPALLRSVAGQLTACR